MIIILVGKRLGLIKLRVGGLAKFSPHFPQIYSYILIKKNASYCLVRWVWGKTYASQNFFVTLNFENASVATFPSKIRELS